MLSLMMITVASWAGPVSKEKAQETATTFVAKKNYGFNKKQMRVAAKYSKVAEAADENYFYVFNIGEDDGFVIVSGDDRTVPVLGYSDEGSFAPDKIPANMKAWLDGYARQLKALAKLPDALTGTVARTTRGGIGTRNSIAPLISTKWDQATPYWNECPDFVTEYIVDPETGERVAVATEKAYTGCVATSMSQMMYFHKYPVEETPEIPAYTFIVPGDNYQYTTVTHEALPPTVFDWANMRETYTGAEPEVNTAAVARLMHYTGCALKTQYGVSSSGAYTDDIPKAFSLFGYGSKLAYRNDYTQEAWENLVYSELAEGRPMIYNGTAGSGGGHSFICDGFEYGNYFHINWGWGGMGNGYFLLSILNPKDSGIGASTSSEGYNMKQNIIYNIIPGGSTEPVEEEGPMLTVTAISGPDSPWARDKSSEPFKIFKSRIVKVSFSDHSGSGKKFKEALALYDSLADTYTLLANSQSYNYSTVTTSALGQTTEYGRNIASNASNVIKFGAGLTGKYRLVPMYQLEGTSEWKPMKESDRYYLELDMADDEATHTAHPAVDLSATDFDFTGNLKVGSAIQVHVTVKNNSVDRYFGDIYLDFNGQKIDEYSQYTTVVQAEIPAGQSSVVTFNVTPQESGTQTVKAMLPGSVSSEYETIGSGSVTIAESEEAEELALSVEIEAVNSSEAVEVNTHGTLYDSHVQFKATITNNADGEYNKYVLAPLFICKWDAESEKFDGSMVTYKQQALSLGARESKTLYFDFDNLAPGSIYSMNIYARNNVPQEEEGTHVENIVEKGHSKYYAIKPGIITWTGDGSRKGYKPVENFEIPADAAAVSLAGLSLANVCVSENPNTLFFLEEMQEIPDGLEGKNIVKGGEAATVVLKDGYDFYTPTTFTAGTISYERTFTQGHHNGVNTGWSTILLPFVPITVTNATDNVAIDWFRSSSDSGKQFWVCDFVEEDGTTVYFRNAPEMQANVPYLVAVPDDAWGSKWDLRGKQIVWSATNATVKPDAIAYTSGRNLAFGGTFCAADIDNGMGMNAEGSLFSSENTKLGAFRAYFKNISENDAPQSARFFNIKMADGTTTGISTAIGSDSYTAVYNMKGQRIGTKSQLQQLPRGVYVVGGAKVMR